MKSPLELAKELVRHLEKEQLDKPQKERLGVSRKAMDIFLNDGIIHSRGMFTRQDRKTLLHYNRLEFEIIENNCYIRTYYDSDLVHTMKLPYSKGGIVTLVNIKASMEVTFDC